MKLAEHPTVLKYRQTKIDSSSSSTAPLDATWLRQLLLEAGADDVGFVEIGRPAIADQVADIRQAFPPTKTLISYVVRMNREPIRSPARSISNLEFHHSGDSVNEIGREIVRTLEDCGIRALNPSMGFPMEMDNFPGKLWVVSHKPVAEAAGLGRMGIHRNIIHPKFGNFILLGTILIDSEVTQTDQPIDYNPCLECKLCVAACPVGAVKPDGQFDFNACYTHNYREFMGGFNEWVERVADSRDAADYRRSVSGSESASMWQSLSFGANYKAAYCLAVCPAGEDVIGPYLDDKREHLNTIVKPLQQKVEPVYVIDGSDAQAHVAKRFPHKKIRQVKNSLLPTSIKGFLGSMHLAFQPGQAKEIDAVYHFQFIGEEEAQATITIRNQTLNVERGHIGEPDLKIQADSAAWLRILRGEQHVGWAIVKRQIRLKGTLKLLVAFGRCFPN